MGRGASDLTAVALASALGADACEIYTDVTGVYTADPRVVPNARRLASVSYEEMLEMAATGGRVLALRSVEFARNHGVALHVRSSFTWEPGTWVRKKEEDVEKAIISGVTHDTSEAKVTVVGVPDQPGHRRPAVPGPGRRGGERRHDRAERLASRASPTSPSPCPRPTSPPPGGSPRRWPPRSGPPRSFADADIARISLVGAGMKTHPGVAATMFETLADEGVNIEMISTSSIRISCVVRAGDVERAVRALHDRFELENPPSLGRQRGPVRVGAMNVGIVGATGLVGGVMRTLLAERDFPVDQPAPVRLAPARPAGRLPWAGGEIVGRGGRPRPTTAASTSSCSRPAPPCPGHLAPRVAAAGAIVVDNSSAWRSDPDVPLVVAEVNPHALAHIPKGIVANPNCTTMVAMPVLKPLHDEAGLRRIVVSTYQAVSGAGVKGVAELEKQAANVGGRADRAGPVAARRRRVPGARGLRRPHRLQRHPPGRQARRRRSGDRRGAEAPQREPQDPRDPRPGRVVHLRAGAGLHRPLAVAEPRVRAAALAGAGPPDPGVGAGRRRWPTSPRHSPPPAPTPPTWAGSAATRGPRTASPCSCAATTCARARRSTPSRSQKRSPGPEIDPSRAELGGAR